MLDVAIIGGGPIGSRIAFKMARAGCEVTVFEKRPGIGEKLCCTGIVSQKCISNFNISNQVIFREVNSAKMFSPSGEFLRVYRPETQACIINRSAFDQSLAKEAQLQGVKYQLRSEVKNIIFQNDRVQIEVEKQGQVQFWEARAAVLTTGFNAPLVKKIGFGQVGDFVTGVQAEVQINGLDEVEVYFDQQLANGFFAWLVPTREGKCLAGLMSRKSPGEHLRNWLKSLEAQGRIVNDSYKINYSGIPIKPLTRTFNNNLLVAGDAAGQVKSTTGGGIYFGMLCADIAADTLYKALQAGDLSANRLSGYEKGWRKKLGHELKREYFARQLYQHLSNNQINAILSRAKTSGIVDLLMKEDFSFDWHSGLVMKVLKAGVVSQANRIFRLPVLKG